MAHDHSHDHFHTEAERTNYYVEQLCTVAACGSLAVVCILMWWYGMLRHMLAPAFWPWVLVGGVVLLAVVLVRAAALWVSVGQTEVAHHHDDHTHGHDHAHDHGHHHHDHAHDHADCGHDHAHGDCGHDHKHDHAHDHAHGHSHDHGDHSHSHDWWPVQIALLTLPIALFLLGLPNAAFSARYIEGMAGKQLADVGGAKDVASRGSGVTVFYFKELSTKASDEQFRAGNEGLTGQLTGQFVPFSDTECTLMRLKITCCGADAIPIKLRIVSETPLPKSLPRGDWVTVTGQVQFREIAGEWVPVLQLRKDTPGDGIERSTAPNNEYEV